MTSDEAPVPVDIEPKKKRQRIPNLRKLLAHPDPQISHAAKLLAVETRLVEILAPFPPEARSRIMRAVAILHGLDV